MNKSSFHIGWRTIKTGVAVFITLTLYHLWHRQPAAIAALACVFTMQIDLPTSIQFGRFRLFGNTVGALLATLVFRFELFLPFEHPLIHISLVTLGIMVLIIICNVFNHSKSIINSSATYFIVLLTVSANHLVSFTINRILDTFIGAIIAIIINYLLPSPHTQSSKNH